MTQHALITPHNQEFRITPRCALRYIQAAGSSVRRQPATMSVLPTVVPPPHTIECFLPPPHTIQCFPLSLSRFTITGEFPWYGMIPWLEFHTTSNRRIPDPAIDLPPNLRPGDTSTRLRGQKAISLPVGDPTQRNCKN